ncbi:MAG TPA: alkaline phosphatase D family protein [Candidatus Binatia bacterium]|nr:alkaline phosphatase D family protein [Candidatus Binatia bacterium]
MSGSAAATFPFWMTASGCAPINAGVPDSDTGLCFGCVAGDVRQDRAVVWLRAEPGGVIRLRYGTESHLERAAETAPFSVRNDCDDTAKIVLEDLRPATTYYYRPVVAGRKPGPIGKFVTAPAPDALTPVKFCFSGDSRESYQPFTLMDSIRAERPHFFLHLGDTIYADIGGRAVNLPDFWAKYRRNRYDLPSQRLFAETSAYVIWDDHEVTNNCRSTHPLMPVGRKAFLDYWPIAENPDDPNRLYRSFRWGKALELFILDARQYRDPRHGTLLGTGQKKWLFEGLASSTALFKFIATPVPFYGGGPDRWDGFPAERGELLNWIANKKISGVVFVTADVHYAAVTRIPGPLGLREVVAGPIGSPMNVITNGYAKRFEFFSNETFNYALVTVDPRGAKPHATVELVADNGRRLYQTKLEPA